MRINHNVMALNTYRQLSSNQKASEKSTEKLSSGLRINRAGDDAAGLAISEKMRSQIRGLDQASRNASDAISMIQTAEGALNETHDILQRMRELAVQASTDTNTSSDRGEIQKEINQLTSEINRIGNTTEFNTQKLLNGDKSTTKIQSQMAMFTAASGFTNTTNISGGTVKLESGAAVGDYKLTVIASGFEGTATTKVGVSGSVTAVRAAVVYSAGQATFDGNKINLSSTASGSMYGQANISGTLKITKSASGFTVEISGFSGATPVGAGAAVSGVSIQDKIVANASGEFVYDNYGISFKITDVGNMANGDTISYTMDSGAAATSAGTKNVLWDTIAITGSGGASNLDAANFKTSSGALLGDYSIEIKSSANGDSGDITLKFSGADGQARVLDTFSGVTFSSGVGKTMTLDSHGISVDLMALGNIDSGTTAKLKFAVTGTNYSVKIENASGTLIGSGAIGQDGGLGIKDGSNKTIGKFQLAYDSGASLASGSTTIQVRGNEVSGAANASGSSVVFQIGANEHQSMSLEVSDMRANALGLTRKAEDGTVKGFTSTTVVNDGTNNTSVEYALDVTTAANAANAITVIDSAIKSVSAERSKLGAYQNRLEHTINNLGTSSENLTSSESRIRDVDMAKEMMANTRNSILQQAAQSMLAQANQAPQQVLQLLR